MSNEQSIRDEEGIEAAKSHTTRTLQESNQRLKARIRELEADSATGQAAHAYWQERAETAEAENALLASPVIRRIQAEAWFEGADAAVHGYDLPDASDIRNPYAHGERYLRAEADRIEQNSEGNEA